MKKSTKKSAVKVLTVKEVIALVKKGHRVLNQDNKPLPLNYVSRMVDKNREIGVTILKAA